MSTSNILEFLVSKDYINHHVEILIVSSMDDLVEQTSLWGSNPRTHTMYGTSDHPGLAPRPDPQISTASSWSRSCPMGESNIHGMS
jgi:hypothetical protein